MAKPGIHSIGFGENKNRLKITKSEDTLVKVTVTFVNLSPNVIRSRQLLLKNCLQQEKDICWITSSFWHEIER